jgi:SAM-dependent methyltransferase
MSTFSADWLRQREHFDTTARAIAAARLGLADWLAARRPAGAPWRVIDLASGTGANLRALAPLLGGAQQWLLVDHDPALLAHAQAGGVEVGHRVLDLAHDLEALPFAGTTLVTASALLDLVSAAWLNRLVTCCAGAGAAVLLTLSVDGRQVWDPADREDGLVRRLFAAHQARDKGFGPALGPRAATAAARAFRAADYSVRSARSDWWLDARSDPDALALQLSLIDGIGGAAIEQAPVDAARLRDWQTRRHALAARSMLRIGHVDLMAGPPPAK